MGCDASVEPQVQETYPPGHVAFAALASYRSLLARLGLAEESEAALQSAAEHLRAALGADHPETLAAEANNGS